MTNQNLDVQKLKARLEAEREVITKEIKENAQVDTAETEFREEVADRLETQDEKIEENLSLSSRLKEIKMALDKITSGTYGQCEVGGEEIEADRLEANPAARTCKAHLDQETKLD